MGPSLAGSAVDGPVVADEAIELEAAFQTLVTGLAVRYYRAVNGTPD